MPFNGRVDPRYFFPSPTHEEAIARLHFLVENHRRLGLVLGAVGYGKSLILEVFAEQLRRSGRAVAKLNLLGLDAAEILWRIAVELGLNPPPFASTTALWRALDDRLAEHRFRQLDTVILLDDADTAERSVLPHIARLADHDSSPDSRLTVILAVEKMNVAHLGNRLLELSDLRIDIEPWTLEDVEGFLTSSLSQAGSKKKIFAADAVAKLHELSGGIPRRIVQLADLALLAGAGAELKQIDAEVIQSVCEELRPVEV
jgi:type II secretory pathway predicted ATPase ExeA